MSVYLAGESVQFIWEIENYDFYHCERGDCLESSEFSVDTLGLMHLELYPKGDIFDNDEYLTLTLNMVNKKIDCLIECTIDLISQSGQIIVFEKISNAALRWKFKRIIKAHRSPSLSPHKNDNLVIKKEILQVLCKFTINQYNEEIVLNSEDYKDLQMLSDDIHKIYCSSQASDFILIYRDNKLPLHKAILNARVPKLAEELKIDECSEGIFDKTHSEINLDILKLFLTYVYSGKIPPLSTDIVQGLYCLSECYEVASLKRKLCCYPNKSICRTTIKVDHKSFTWTINDFDKFEANIEFYGPSLGSGIVPNSDLHFVAKVLQENSEIYNLQVTINRMFPKKESIPLFIQCIVTVGTFTGDTIYKYSGKHLFNKCTEWKLPSFFTLNKTNKTSDKGIYRLSNGHVLCLKGINFRLNVEYFVCGQEAVTNVISTEKNLTPEMISRNFTDDIKTLSLDLGKLYNIFLPKASDVILHVGDVRFPAHKVVLSARSPVFSRMFENEMLEKKNETVNISDIDVATLNLMLAYFYSGKLDMVLNYDSALLLYTASDKYDVSSLKDKCITILKSNLTEENVCSLLILADMHSDNSLKNFAVSYICKKSDVILTLPKWKELISDRIDLASEVIQKLMSCILFHRESCVICSKQEF